MVMVTFCPSILWHVEVRYREFYLLYNVVTRYFVTLGPLYANNAMQTKITHDILVWTFSGSESVRPISSCWAYRPVVKHITIWRILGYSIEVQHFNTTTITYEARQ